MRPFSIHSHRLLLLLKLKLELSFLGRVLYRPSIKKPAGKQLIKQNLINILTTLVGTPTESTLNAHTVTVLLPRKSFFKLRRL